MSALLNDPKSHLLYTRENGTITGFYLIREHEQYVEGVRLAVAPVSRGGGLGKKLVRRALRYAVKKEKQFKTYCAAWNTRSATLHIQSGMALSALDKDWIYLSTRQPWHQNAK